MAADPLAPLLLAVFDPDRARPSGRLRPVMVGSSRTLLRLPRALLWGLVVRPR